MRLPNRNTVSRLEVVCAGILKGMSLKEWAEHVVIHALESAGQSKPPSNIVSEQLLKQRRIVDLCYQASLPERGSLREGADGFEVRVRLAKPDRGFWHQFTVAHEIAHTFLYDLEDWPPQKKVRLQRGDADIEWLCDHLAKCLVIPARWLYSKLMKYPNLGENDFSLAVLQALGTTFKTPPRLVADRLVEDLGEWKCVMVLFRKLAEPTEPSENSVRLRWRQTWNTIPQESLGKLYIPVGHRMDSGHMKFPRAKGYLRQLLETWGEESQENAPFRTCMIPWKSLNSSATGNLGTYVHGVVGTDEVPIYIAIRRPSTMSLFEWMPSRKPREQVLMCIPLTGMKSHSHGWLRKSIEERAYNKQ